MTGKLRAARCSTPWGRGARRVIYGRMDAGETIHPGSPASSSSLHKHIEGFWLSEWMRVTPDVVVRPAVVMEAQKRFARRTL